MFFPQADSWGVVYLGRVAGRRTELDGMVLEAGSVSLGCMVAVCVLFGCLVCLLCLIRGLVVWSRDACVFAPFAVLFLAYFVCAWVLFFWLCIYVRVYMMLKLCFVLLCVLCFVA